MVNDSVRMWPCLCLLSTQCVEQVPKSTAPCFDGMQAAMTLGVLNWVLCVELTAHTDCTRVVEILQASDCRCQPDNSQEQHCDDYVLSHDRVSL